MLLFFGAVSLTPLQLVIAHVNGSTLIGGLLMLEWIYAAQINPCSGGVTESLPDRTQSICVPAQPIMKQGTGL